VIQVLSALAAVGFAAVLAASGARLRRLLRLPVPPRLALATDFTLGCGMAGLALVALGLARGLATWSLVALLVAAAATGRWRRNGWRVAPLLAPGAAAVLLLPVALAPPFFYDALIYHLGLPWLALLERAWLAHPETVYASAPPLVQCLALVPLALGLERVPALLHLVSFVLAGTAVDAAARRLGARAWAARVAAFCVPLAPLYVLVPGLPAAEGFGTVAVVTAVAGMLATPTRRGRAALVGLLLGAGTAARVQVAPLVALVAVAAALLWRRGGSLPGLAGGALAGSATWWARNLLLYGVPWLPLGFAGAGAQAMWRDAVSPLGGELRPIALLRPLADDLGPHLGVLGPLALGAALLVLRRPHRRELLLGGIVVGALAAWLGTAAIPRYLAPVFALLVVMAAGATSFRLGRWAAGAALVSAAVLAAAVTVVHVRRIGGLGLAFGERARVEAALVVNDPLPAFRAAAGLPHEAFVAFVGEPRGFAFPRRFLAPSYYDASPLLPLVESAADAAAAAAALRARGMTHVLVNWGELRRLAAGYPVLPFASPAGGARFRAVLAACGPPVVAAGGVEIYALGPAQPLPDRRPPG